MRISDWSSDVCSSDLDGLVSQFLGGGRDFLALLQLAFDLFGNRLNRVQLQIERSFHLSGNLCRRLVFGTHNKCSRSEEHTSELQSLMRISSAVFCLKKRRNKYTELSQSTRLYSAQTRHTRL